MSKKERNPSLSAFIPRVSMEITDMCNLLIDGCRGIRFYSPEKIRLETVCGEITVSGKRLIMATAKTGKLVITGKITAISSEETK